MHLHQRFTIGTLKGPSKNNYDFTVVTNKTICEGWVGALGGSNQVGNLGGVGGVGQGYLGNLFARETLT